MTEADIPKSARHLRRLQELVEDQKRRIALIDENRDASGAQRAQSLLAVLEECLACAHYMLAKHSARAERRADVKPERAGASGQLVPVGTRGRGQESKAPRLLFTASRAAAAHLLTVNPTRAALAWSLASPLTPYPETERELAACGATFPLDASAPPGSLGEACDAFRRANALAPIDARLPADAAPARKLAARRLAMHDSLHVLLDFKPDWPGQLGVFSFVAAQRYCPQFEWAARRLAQVYMTAAPWLRDDLAFAEYRGRQLAHCAPRLLSMPIEQQWGSSLMALQVRWNLRSERSLRTIDWAREQIRPHPRAVVTAERTSVADKRQG